MSEPAGTHADDDHEWPTNCPLCGSKLVPAVIDLDTTNENRAEFNAGEMIALDYCPNPSCSGKNAPPTPEEPGS